MRGRISEAEVLAGAARRGCRSGRAGSCVVGAGSTMRNATPRPKYELSLPQAPIGSWGAQSE